MRIQLQRQWVLASFICLCVTLLVASEEEITDNDLGMELFFLTDPSFPSSRSLSWTVSANRCLSVCDGVRDAS